MKASAKNKTTVCTKVLPEHMHLYPFITCKYVRYGQQLHYSLWNRIKIRKYSLSLMVEHSEERSKYVRYTHKHTTWFVCEHLADDCKHCMRNVWKIFHRKTTVHFLSSFHFNSILHRFHHSSFRFLSYFNVSLSLTLSLDRQQL